MSDGGPLMARADRLQPVILGALVMAVALWAAHPYAVGVFTTTVCT